MTTAQIRSKAIPRSTPVVVSEPVVAIKRRTIDTVLIASGAVVTAVLFVAGGLLMWGSNFSADYVHDELASQHIAFPPAAALKEDGRSDLLKWAGQDVETGKAAEAYASFIDGHLQKIGNGATYADLGTPERAAKANLQAAVAEHAAPAQVAELKAKADGLTAQRDTMFKGETLRGLLLSAFAWSTVGAIAGYAAIAAMIAGGVMLVLVLLGLRHHHKLMVKQS